MLQTVIKGIQDGSVWFYVISTFVGFSKRNPVFTHTHTLTHTHIHTHTHTRSRLRASCGSSHTEEFWHNETFCLWMTIYIYIYIYTYIYTLISLSLSIYIYIYMVVEEDSKAPLSIATTPRSRGGLYSIPWIAPLYPGPLIVLSVKQGGIKYRFLSLCYNSTCDWTLVSRAIRVWAHMLSSIAIWH